VQTAEERGKFAKVGDLREASEHFSWTLPGAPTSPLDAECRGLRRAIVLSSDDIYRSRFNVIRQWLTDAGWGTKPGTLQAVDVDRALCVIFDELLRGELKGGKAAIVQMFAAVKHAYPHWNLPLGHRYGAKVVPRVAPTVERKGLPWELVLLGAIRMKEAGQAEAALRTVLKFDCLCRGEDIEALRVRDVLACRDKIVLRMGTPLDHAVDPETLRARKTGFDGGVIVNLPWIAEDVHELSQDRPGHEYLFRQERSQWEAIFRKTFQELGVTKPVPHQLRHGGASNMVLQGKSLWEVQTRGMWRAKTSVARYAKPWAVLIAWAALTRTVQRDAKRVAEDPATAWRAARRVERVLF